MFEIYGSIGIASGVVQAAYLLTAFGLGFVLLSRARSSGDPHPRLLGWHLILSMGVGYLLLCIAVASFELGIEMDPTWRGAFVGFGNLVTSMGLLATLVFTRRVFRPDDPLATAAVWILGSLMFSGLAIYGLTGGFPTARYDNVGGAVLLLGIFGSNVWVSYEPLRYYRLMKRRLEFGLADPAVVDRFLLWGLGSASRLLLSGLGVGAALTV
ncbi:MAG: hypothetical protein GY723_20655, partial [bacterium]|nr:hypothetical protein [bacterium]